jgi:predicted HicB family RNase H-like nuclease
MIAVEKQAEVERFAQQLFSLEKDWVRFYREVLGVQGIVRQMFPQHEDLEAFKRTDAYRGILRLLAELRGKKKEKESPETSDEPTRVITVRLPQSMHEALQAEAYGYRTSVNKLCISKLLQAIDNGAEHSGQAASE